MWIDRKNTDRIEEAIKTRPVVLLTGVRQVGKSSLLQKLFKKTKYITLDKIILAEEAETNPTKFLDRFKSQVIIDEIQYAPSLFRELKIRVDENRNIKGKWILTGSQQFMLMQQISESLAGRIRILNLGTLSATELNNTDLLINRRDLLWRGGFPEIWAENLDSTDFFEDYIQTYLERDLRNILKVTNLRDFRRFLSLLAFRVGQLMNYSEISKEVGVAVNTVKAWVSALETSGLIILLPPYYNNLGKRIIKAPKLYFCDNGLVAALLNINSLESLENSLHLDNIWENFVFTEYLKDGLIAGKNLFYIRDKNGVEIDFIIEKEGKVILVEAKSSERPNPKKLNFSKIAPLFKQKVTSVVACGVEEEGIIYLKDYSVYNPLFGFSL
ncbi:MAG: ATP-binding protein [Flavobacteriaceae bacterium]|nr:ATP-binding protein [Flavobacteriaceae bacterium]